MTMQGSTLKNLLVSTDLDGTLLDHFTYSWDAAKPALKELARLNVPVVINTSKTFDEVLDLQERLGLNAPFVVENGSAVCFPSNYPYQPTESLELRGKYNIKVLGERRERILGALNTLRQQRGFLFEGYNDWSIDQVIEHTGLNREEAVLSKQRSYSEPIHWHDSENNFIEFESQLSSFGLRTIRGGRFVHILGQNNKGSAVLYLKEELDRQLGNSHKIIALGDSYNDIDMLKVADFPVMVKSPTHDFPPANCNNTVIYTKEFGPAGWNSTINTLLKTTELYHG